jgi:RimJ/RimL family protein N-acetyltransferase
MHEKNQFNQSLGFLVEHWATRERPTKVIMHGRYCTLEKLDLNQHAAVLFQALSTNNQGESWTYLPYGPFNTLDEFIRWARETIADKETILYAIVDPKTKGPIDICAYLRINPEHGVVEVGHLHYSALLKQTPAATETMFLMMHYALEELKYRRYEWKCNALNEPSKQSALRLGFQFEGTFRQSNVFKNRNRDTAWFSIVDSEWPAIKARFERWLDTNNFDQHGHQKTCLQEI